MEDPTQAINRAFSRQSFHYDEQDAANMILRDMRKQVYKHLDRFLKPTSHILELNAGTGIDALYLVSRGHTVHATDLSEGMIAEIEKKIENCDTGNQLTCQQLSYEHLDEIKGKKFDFVFSNFGGLNCIDDLRKVTAHLPPLLNDRAIVTWVIMPPVCLWELLWLLKGRTKKAFRRFSKKGIMAHVEGEYFQTYYHSLTDIEKAFGPGFKFIKSEGLAALSPQPHHNFFPEKFPQLYKILRKLDALVRNHSPFNRWADHIIVTFEYCAEGACDSIITSS